MVDLLRVASWLLLPPTTQSSSKAWEDAPTAVDDVGLCKEGSPLAHVGGSPLSSPNVQADDAEFQQLLTEHRALIADFAKLRAEVDVVVGCLERHGIAVPLRRRGGSDGKASAPGASFEGVLALPNVASRVFAAAGQVGWSSALRLSRSSLSSARSVQEEKLFVVGGSDAHGDSAIVEVEAFGLRSRTWQPAPPLPSQRSGHVMGVIGGYLYVCGGLFQSARSTVCFSPASHEWTALADLKRPRSLASAVVLNRGLYVVGGATLMALWRSIECLRPSGPSQTSAWSIISGKMQTARRSFAAVALQGKIFMCGGCEQLLRAESTPDASSATAEVFSLTAGVSHRVASMSTPRAFHTATVIGNKVLVAGGSMPGTGRAQRSVELYSTSENHWLQCPDWAMSFERGGHNAIAIAGRLFIMGGIEHDLAGSPSLPVVQRLDLATGMWDALEPMKEARAAFSSGLIACGP